jgi:hypothetical protein
MPKDLKKRLKVVKQQLKKSAVEISQTVTTELLCPLAKEVIKITPLPHKIKKVADKIVDKVDNKLKLDTH